MFANRRYDVHKREVARVFKIDRSSSTVLIFFEIVEIHSRIGFDTLKFLEILQVWKESRKSCNPPKFCKSWSRKCISDFLNFQGFPINSKTFMTSTISKTFRNLMASNTIRSVSKYLAIHHWTYILAQKYPDVSLFCDKTYFNCKTMVKSYLNRFDSS